LAGLVADRANQDDGVVHRNDDGATGLAGDFAGFQGHLMGAVGEAFLDDIKHGCLSQ
jgi:hypothetical protein